MKLRDIPFAFPRRPASVVGPIGIEVSLEYLHLVQLHMSEGQVRLRATASELLGGAFDDLLKDPERFRLLMRDTLNRGPFKGRRVVAAMPSTMTRVISVNYRVKEGQDDGQAISRLLMDRIGDDLSDFVVDFMPINHDRRVADRAALIAMCRKDKVHGFLDVITRSGLEPLALEIGPVAIKRLVDTMQARNDNVDASSLVVNCGREKSYLTLISNRNLLSDDEVDFGERTVVERVCRALDIEEALAVDLLQQADLGAERPDDNLRTLLEIIRPELNTLVREIGRGLVYATSENRGRADHAVFLIGSIARWRGADRLLSSILNHKVRTIPNPLSPFLSPRQREADTEYGRPELAIAAGLALRDFQHG